MDVIEGLLHELHSNCEDSFKVESIINKISHYYKVSHNGSSIDLSIFLLFGENGLISFINKVLRSEVHKSNVLNIFSVLEFLLVSYEKFCIPYVEDIKNLCLGIAHYDIPAKIKENALKLLKCVFAPSFIMTLDLSNIINTIIHLREDLSPSVQAQLFSVVGIIFEKMPEITENENDFLNYFIKKIKGSRKSGVSLLSGCLDGINGYLVNFVPNSEQISDIYSYVKEICSTKPRRKDFTYRETRRNAERSALKIINRHYRVFAVYIYKDIEYWHETLNYWLEKSKEDRHLGFGGLIAVYKAIAYVCSLEQDNLSTDLETIVSRLLSRQSNFNVASAIGLVELISTGHVREEIANRALQLITKRFSTKSDSSMYLSLNLECVSKYLTKSNTVKADYLIQIQRMAVALINGYPKTDKNFKRFSLQALEKSFYYVERCGPQELDEYVKEVIYQGLIRSCSCQIHAYTEIQKEITGKELVSHKSFLPLWIHITNLGSSNTELEYFDSKNVIASKVLDEYVSAFLKINKKLDLRFHVGNPYISSAETTAEALRPNDWQIFINNVNLFVDVIEEADDLYRMKKWLMRILSEAMDSAYRAPLISDYYKIITTCFKVADKIQFFDECTVDERIIQRFLWNVSLRVGQYKGDTQISCFQTLLAAPVRLIEPFVKDLVPIFKIILHVSSGNFSLLQECVSTLEKWFTCSPKGETEFLLKSVLPYFEVFLQSNLVTQSVVHVNEPLKVSGRMRNFYAKTTDNNLFYIQKKFLLFVGSLDTDISKHLINSKCEEDDEDEENECFKVLTYDIPLSDRNLRIRFEFLPRVIELAMSSGDRCTRIRACEFLHSVVSLTLGNMKKMDGELNRLFRKLVPLCLLLACDSDHKILQIYELLTTQMVHYFAGRERNFSETEIFIDCLTKSVSHPYNSTLRDLAVRLIREFVKWSLKSVTSSGEISNNIKLILKSMYSLSIHPSYNKRRGAAIVFNYIYSLIEDETDLLNTNWFLFYYYFMESLSMCTLHEDTSHITNAIELINKSLKGRELNTNPKVPPGFNDNFLNTLVAWIFSHCSHHNAIIRKLSMGIIENFSKDSVKEFIRVHVNEVYTKKEYITNDQNERDPSTCLNHCSSLFDYYNWLLMHDAVNEQDLKNAGVEELLALFLDNINIDFNIWDAATFVESSGILHMLNFLLSSINRNIIVYNQKILALLKICLYRPSKYKFEVCDHESRERLGLILNVLIPKIVSVMKDDEIEYLLGADEYFLSMRHLGEYLQNKKPLWEMVELLNGLKMLYSLQLWDTKIMKNISGNGITHLVFSSIFTKRSRRCSGFLIEEHDKVFLADFMKFGIELGVSLDVMIDILKNEEEVIEEETFKKTTKSEYFMNMFKEQLFDYLIRISGTAIDAMLLHFPNTAVITIFNTLNHSSRSNLSSSYKKKFVFEICRRWKMLKEDSSNNSKILLLSCLRSMCQVIPEVLVEDYSVRDWFFNVVANTKVPEEAEIIFDLCLYVSPVNEDFNERLTCVLDQIFRNLEFFTSESDKPDPKVVVAYKGLLNSFTRTRSLTILREIIRILKKYKNLQKENEIESILANICQTDSNKLSDVHRKRILSFLYGELFHKGGRSDEVYELFLLKLLQKSDSGFVWGYLLEVLDDLLGVLKGENLIYKTSALKIIQACVVKAKRKELEEVSDGKKEAFRNCISICSKIPLTEESELLRKYVCCCFNTLCAVISVKSDDQRLYKSLIFKEDFPFLPRMICQKKKWVLRMDFDELPKRRKVLIALRKSITKERQIKLGKTIGSIQYLQGETLFDSSLSEDVMRFQFSNYIIRPLNSLPKTELGEHYLELELDEINSHECMATLIGIIRHMVEEGITPVKPGVLPFWLSSLTKRMVSLNSSENEKIFLLKLMCNTGEYIKPYAKFIVSDILHTLLEVFQEKPINYLVIDLITMILNWKLDWDALNRQLQASFTQLAVYIIKKSDANRKDIIKSNLEVAKLIIETCKDNMNLSALSMHAFTTLETGIKFPTEDKTVLSYLNFQFCGILLANSIPAWAQNREEEFMRMVLGYFSDEKNGKLAAEIYGLSLQYLKRDGFHNIDKLVEMAKEKIQYIKSIDSGNDLPLIYAVYKSFPEFCSSFVATLRNSAWNLRGQFKAQSLEMLLSHLKTVTCPSQTMFGSTIYSFLLDMLSPDDFEALSVSLQIVEVILDKAADSKMSEVFEKALSFGDYKISRVRKSVYNIAATLFEKWDEVYSKRFTENIKRMCRIVLISGMNDKESDLSERCLEFWYSRTRGSNSSSQFANVLCELYTPETEKGFFNFAAKLMIRSAAHGPDFEKCIFEHPLVFNSTFQKKVVSSSAYYSTVAPSFSVTLSGTLNQSSLFQQENEHGFDSDETSTDMLKQRRRFIRDVKKIQKYFAKKKTALEEELERRKAGSGNEVDLVREYKDGDFPFIQISHYDLLKPLEELTMRDPQIGRYFLTSIYNGFVENITDEVKEMIIKLGELVRQVFEENPSSDPAIIAFLFHILMHCGWHVKADPETISKVAKSSGWYSVGGLLIEDLITLGEVEVPAVRRKGVTDEEKAWLNLVELTRCLKEFEVLRGIMIDKLRVGVNTSEAIRYESASDWFNASMFYESALRQGESSLNDFCVNAYLNSLAQLSDWTKLNTYIRNTYDMNDLWSDPSLFEKVLPWFMKSATIQSESSDVMLEIISEIQQDSKKGNDLKKFFVEELTVYHLLNGKSQWVEYYLYQICLKFLSNWSHWNKWTNNLRLSKLIEFQFISEVDQCLRVLKEKTNVEVSKVMYLWSKNRPKECDDLMNWDLKLTLRNHVLSKLRNSCPDLDLQQIQSSVTISKFDLVKCGISQRNVKISEKYLNGIKEDMKIYKDYKLQLMHDYYSSSLELLKEERRCEKGKNSRPQGILDASSRLHRQMTSMMDTHYGGCNVLFYECNMKLSKVMYLLQSFEEDSLGYAATVLDIPRGKIKEGIEELELEYLRNAGKAVEGLDEKLLSKTYIEMAKYHRRLGYNRQLAKCLFRSMSLGNTEARQLFCCLLNEVKIVNDWVSDQEVKSSFEAVPVWMFLKWTNQLLANLDSEMFPFLKDVLSSIAEEYPNSIRYAFELSRSNFKYAHKYGDECRTFVNVLAEKLMSDNHYCDFLTALSFVVSPDSVLKYGISKIYAEVKSSYPNWDNVTGLVQDLYQLLYGEELKRFRGPAFDCLSRIKHDVELLLSLKRENSLWQEKLENITKSTLNCTTLDTLKQYSPWLYNFHATNQNIRIELPGQYNGDQKPMLKYHVFISSFKHRVLVMNSKCKPIRICILGDDAREYGFLVKFGEDLRQDQRIQQAFSHMNYVLHENQQTSHFIDTYKVIPLKCNLGIIEWVNNTISLYEMLATSNSSFKNTVEMVQKQHLEFLAQDNKVTNVVTSYLNGFQKVNRDNAVARFTERVYSFEWDLLRKAFWNLSTYPEQFFYLRKNFASSEAVIFIAHWLIGIGDRHLNNTLVSLRTGRALGIDFGYAFGFATEFLTPPELIPFRLTPQIINLMKPLGTNGLIKEIMIQCLKAFCREKSMILATFGVFATEPALDWLEKARRDNALTKTSEWSPWKKIAMVKQKLEGANPIQIFRDDLKSGHSDSECLEKYLEVLRGDGSRCCEPYLTEEKQVECLIDLASDYHVLSKTYVGWNPWL